MSRDISASISSGCSLRPLASRHRRAFLLASVLVRHAAQAVLVEAVEERAAAPESPSLVRGRAGEGLVLVAVLEVVEGVFWRRCPTCSAQE